MVIHRLLHNSSTINPQVTWGNSENTEFRSFPASKALRSARSRASAGFPGQKPRRLVQAEAVLGLAADHQSAAGGGHHFVDLASVAVLLPAAGLDLLTARLPHQPGQRVRAERPASRPVLRSRHPAIMTALTA